MSLLIRALVVYAALSSDRWSRSWVSVFAPFPWHVRRWSEALCLQRISAKHGRSSSGADSQNRRGPWQNINLPLKQTAISLSSSSASPTHVIVIRSPFLHLSPSPSSSISRSRLSIFHTIPRLRTFDPFISAVWSCPPTLTLCVSFWFYCLGVRPLNLSSKLISLWTGLEWFLLPLPQDVVINPPSVHVSWCLLFYKVKKLCWISRNPEKSCSNQL